MITRHLTIIVITLLSLISFTGAASMADGIIVPNEIKCKHRTDYVKPVTTYCGVADIDFTKPHFFIQALLDSAGGESLLRLRIAIFALTDSLSARRLCQLIDDHTIEVSISVQEGTGSESAVEIVRKCADDHRVQAISIKKSGMRLGGIRSYHPKLVYMETPTRKLSFVGSGNATKGLLNFDYWYKFESPKSGLSTSTGDYNSVITNWIDCISSSLNSPKFDSKRVDILNVSRICNQFNLEDKFFLMPGASRAALMRMAYLSGPSAALDIVTQGFNSADIVDLASRMLRDGRSVRILLDDDIYWSSIYPRNENLKNERYEYEEYLTPLILSGAEVRYVITNHNDLVGNFLHSKMYLFEGQDKRIVAMIGSANATQSAFGDNVELLFEIPLAESMQALQYFNAIWGRAIPHSEMPLSDPFSK